MEHEYACVTQLDLAARQFHVDEATFARFALILVDNVVELMLYAKCESVFVKDDGFFSYGKQFGGKHEYDVTTRAKVMGRHFDERPKFCRRLGVLTEDETEFILSAHQYRNEVYHVGIRHEDVLRPIAWQYHELACDVFRRLSPIWPVWRHGLKIPESVVRHTGPEGIRIESYQDDIEATATSLASAKPALPRPFSEMLGDAALERIHEFEAALRTVSYDSDEIDLDVFINVQFYSEMMGEHSPHLDALASMKSPAEVHAFLQKQRAHWQPRFPTSPVARWMARARKVRVESDALKAMKRFQTLVDEMESITPQVFEAAREVDAYIQMQIDEMRGK